MANDYIIMYDENGQPYISHASIGGTIDSVRRAGAKYLAKIRTAAGRIRYIYTPDELNAYKKQQSRSGDSSNLNENKHSGEGRVGVPGRWGDGGMSYRHYKAQGSFGRRDDPDAGGRDTTRRKRVLGSLKSVTSRVRGAVDTIRKHATAKLWEIKRKRSTRKAARFQRSKGRDSEYYRRGTSAGESNTGYKRLRDTGNKSDHGKTGSRNAYR